MAEGIRSSSCPVDDTEGQVPESDKKRMQKVHKVCRTSDDAKVQKDTDRIEQVKENVAKCEVARVAEEEAPVEDGDHESKARGAVC